MGAKHTPGPWRLRTEAEHDADPSGGIGDILAPDGEVIAYTYGDRDEDAALIAAAPDMYSALLRFVNTDPRTHPEGPWVTECRYCGARAQGIAPNEVHAVGCELDAARAALAKAEGR